LKGPIVLFYLSQRKSLEEGKFELGPCEAAKLFKARG